jgi:predicted mannosyl-3-phosphoglycerate phosphatase (HAD superfamily)
MRKTPVVAFVDIDPVPAPSADSRGALARMLELLARERVMLVFYSQRTRAQVESTRQAFGVFHPFVTEGGSAAFLPERYFGSEIQHTRKIGGYEAVEFATPYQAVVDTVRFTAERLNVGVLGFGDMSVEQVARECGLSLLEARLAKLREYGEQFRLLSANPVAERRLFRALEHAGLVCRNGANFHVATAAKGPQAAVALLTGLYRSAFGSVLTAAAVEGAGFAELAPHVDVALAPIVLEPDDPLAGLNWLERIVQECDNARAAQHAARAARVAR